MSDLGDVSVTANVWTFPSEGTVIGVIEDPIGDGCTVVQQDVDR